jgi:hypothetical protein
MWAVTRRWSTAFYLLMLIIVFIVAVLKQNILLVLFLLVIEIMASLWYSLSFVPFGRKMFMAFLRQTGACMPCFYVYDAAKAKYDEIFPPKSTATSVGERVGVVEKKDTSISGRMGIASKKEDPSIASRMGLEKKKDTSFSGRMSNMFGGSDKA